jgi:predicted  nucleic acid-binding Zn-ribbon protein
MLTYTLREAADLCDTTVKALRNRADRGSLQTVLRNNERRVPHAELERAGLLPDAEVKQLHQRITQLTDELAASRQLLVSNERSAAAEREARERLEAALYERQAAATAAEAALEAEQQRAAAAFAAAGELRGLEADLRAAGPIRAWKLARTRRRAADAS